MTFKSLFGPITKLSLSFVTFRVSHFPVLHLTYVTVKLGLQNTLNMSKTTRVYFGVLQMGFHGQSALETMLSGDLGEVSLTHAEVREGIPLEQITSWPDKATSSRSGCNGMLLPDQLLLNSYIPRQGQAPPMEEVSALKPEGAQEIINRWKPFNRGESLASHMEQLYPTLLRMLIVVRARGKGEEYAVLVPSYACKEDLKQVVEDDMLIRNRNFVQSAKLVSS